MQEFHKTRYFIVSHNFAENLLILPQNDQNNKQIILLPYAPVTLSRFDSPIRPDLKIGVDRGSVWVSRSKVWTGRDESGAAPTVLNMFKIIGAWPRFK
jgi:hypothetical protein